MSTINLLKMRARQEIQRLHILASLYPRGESLQFDTSIQEVNRKEVECEVVRARGQVDIRSLPKAPSH